MPFGSMVEHRGAALKAGRSALAGRLRSSATPTLLADDVRLLERHLSRIKASTSGFPGISYQSLIRVKAVVPTPIRCLLELNQFVLPPHGRHRRIAAGP